MKTSLFNDFVETSRRRINFNEIKNNLYQSVKKYDDSFCKSKKQFKELEEAKNIASNLKDKALKNLYYNLTLFEKKATANGTKVLWADNSDTALTFIKTIVEEKKATTIVKSKSMVSEEIDLNTFLKKLGVNVFETNFGDFIQQLDGEPSIHMLTPTMHKSKKNIADIFNKKLGVDENINPEDLTRVARSVLRKKYIKAEIGITGANFILPDIGGIAITENEGNARITVAFPKTHIAIVGIEKIINSVKDLSIFWPLLSTFGTGQKISTYNTIIIGPKTLIEKNGPDEMYVILLDNGRTNLIQNPQVIKSLKCIKCGACLNICPVYKSIGGGHGYLSTYSGPIGSVITPYLKGIKKYGHLSFASSLCGACTEICPVKIDIHNLLLETRKQSVEKKLFTRKEKITWKLWTFWINNFYIFNILSKKIKDIIFRKLLSPKWMQVKKNSKVNNDSFYK